MPVVLKQVSLICERNKVVLIPDAVAIYTMEPSDCVIIRRDDAGTLGYCTERYHDVTALTVGRHRDH